MDKVTLFRQRTKFRWVGADSIVKKILKVPHPDRFKINSFAQGDWDGYVRFYNAANNTFEHGFLDFLIRGLEKHKIEYKIVQDFDENLFDDIMFSQPFLDPSRDYQRQAIHAFFKRNFGIIKIPTRGGKTFVSAEIMRLFLLTFPNSKIVFITESAPIFIQNKEEISKFLNTKIGSIRGKITEISTVNVAMSQTLQVKAKKAKNKTTSKEEKQEINSLFESFDFVIVDECHEFRSDDRIAMLKKFKNTKMILGLSATPVKEGDLLGNMQMFGYFGDVVYEIKESLLVERGVLAENKVILITSKFKVKDGTPYKNSLEKVYFNNEQRISLIKHIIDICVESNWKILLMLRSKVFGKILAKRFGILFLCGEDGDDVREETKSKFLSENGGVLIVNDIWKKGITLPEVQVMMNCDGGKQDSSILQKRGRVLGATEGKNFAVAIDIIDMDQRYFSEHSLKRIEAYEKMTDNIEIFEDNEEGRKEIHQSLKDWFIQEKLR